MAFKPSPKTPEERAQRDAEMLLARRRNQDSESFRGEEPMLQPSLRIVDHPVVEPVGSLTTIKARDEHGVLSLILQGDRSGETMFEERTQALSRELSKQPLNTATIRHGVAADVVGVPAQVNWNNERDPKGQFRAVFVETMTYEVDGQQHMFGRPRVAEQQPVVKEQGANVVDFVTRDPSPRAVERPAFSDPSKVVALGLELAEEDRDLFGDRKLRPMTLDVSGVARTTPQGDVVFDDATNARGKVALVLPLSRGDAFLDTPAEKALEGALAAGQTVAVHAEGVFQSRDGKDEAGKPVKHWDFKMARGAFEVDGQAYTIGRSVIDERTFDPTAKAPRSAGRRGRAEER